MNGLHLQTTFYLEQLIQLLSDEKIKTMKMRLLQTANKLILHKGRKQRDSANLSKGN